ncbi:hemicentin-1-like [Anneissia japonica]|uniref:hemicentin-1-like n=1 Tax=Anneissia japonica TaxID=1529436 RepID=UPI00142553E0|nr:hemicentin-1-like [Anneissia japonica]
MLLYLEEKYGRVTSFTSTYTANTWNITIDLAKDVLQTDMEHSTVFFTENVFPWKTKLTIVGLENDDDYGTYACRGKDSQNDVTILQKEPISMETPQRQNLTFRESGTIRCKVAGRPTPKVMWTVNEKPINESSKYVILADGSLRVNDVAGSDAGEYICEGFQRETGDNQAKLITVTIIYEVPTAPLIWVLDEDIKSRSAIIHINSSNSLDVLPGFHYVLYVNGTNLTVSGSTYNDEVSLSIDVTPLTPSTDYDVYGVAVSEGGTSESSNHIKFQTNDDETQRLIVNTYFGIIICKLDFYSVTWKKDGYSLPDWISGYFYFYKYILIVNVDYSDAGTYTCIGNNLSCSINVIVEEGQ